jgi:glucose/arabinose dehydrogenase
MSKTLKAAFIIIALVVVIAIVGFAITGDTARMEETASVGADPTIPEPQPPLIPTVNIAPAKGWSNGTTPVAANGLKIIRFAGELDHPRWLFILPNNDTLVAESNAPPRPEDGTGIKGWVMKFVMRRAGSSKPSANRISLLRDADKDGVAELKTTFISGLNSPFGMALIDNNLFIANTDAIVRFPYVEGATEITEPGSKVADLPGGPLNHHWTKGLIASDDGLHLYASVGSNSNVAENGIEKEEGRAAIHEIEVASGNSRIFASGLRNPVGMAWEPQTKALWTVVNERDELGSDLVPDYLTSVKDGGFYGWPYSYYGQHVDTRVSPPQPELVAKAIVPDYALGNHVAPLGLAFSEGTLLPEQLRAGVFVGEHGSWNRNPHSGYKVVFVPFKDGKPTGQPIDVLTGFLDAEKNALGRPVGVAIDKTGALLVADDVGNVIWHLSPKLE